MQAGCQSIEAGQRRRGTTLALPAALQRTAVVLDRKVNRGKTLSEARRQGFSPVTPLSSPPSLVNGSANKIKAKTIAISTLSNLTAELSLRTRWQVTGVACDKRSMCCM